MAVHMYCFRNHTFHGSNILRPPRSKHVCSFSVMTRSMERTNLQITHGVCNALFLFRLVPRNEPNRLLQFVGLYETCSSWCFSFCIAVFISWIVGWGIHQFLYPSLLLHCTPKYKQDLLSPTQHNYWRHSTLQTNPWCHGATNLTFICANTVPWYVCMSAISACHVCAPVA
jgi:hypothetical protein